MANGVKFIRKGGRVIPIRDRSESRVNTVARKTAAGAKVGGSLAGMVVASHHLSHLVATGRTVGNFRNVGKTLGIGLAAGAALGAISGVFAKRRKK